MFMEKDRVEVRAVKIPNIDEQLEGADKTKIKEIMARVRNGDDYEPIKVSSCQDKATLTLKDGLETYLALWRLGEKYIQAEITLD